MGNQTLNVVLFEALCSRILRAGFALTSSPRNTSYELAKLPIVGPICGSVPMRRAWAPASMSSTKITTLDQRLYAWLVQPDDRKFELAFNAYFSVAFPAVVRHLVRISRWDPSHVEELAQDALLKFFDRAGRGRRLASQAIQQALASIPPLHLGPFHQHQVNQWTSDVSSFRDDAIGFTLSQTDEADGTWKTAIHTLADRIPPLQRQGCHILHTVQVQLHWDIDEKLAARGALPEADELIDLVAGEQYMAAEAFTNSLAAEIETKTPRAQAVVEDHPGAPKFVDCGFTVVSLIPRLRVPSNGYLFEISMTLYLDECKKRNRRKRGGAGAAARQHAVMADGDHAQHPLTVMELDSGHEFDSEDRFEDSASIAARDDTPRAFVTAAADPTPQYEQEDLFEKFYEYLRKPVADATQACEVAGNARQVRAERQKLDSLAAKFDRTTSVLALMGEGYTQEATAERLGISRNQVKYIIELVQDAYIRFTAASTRSSAIRSTGAGDQQNAE
jgi:DNA-directed RNA polymerase specialized sigma24 family protein